MFESQAGDLAAVGTSGRNVLLHDLDRGTTTLILTNFTTTQGLLAVEGSSVRGATSEDGRWMAFLRSTSSSRIVEPFVRNLDGQVLCVDAQDTWAPTVVLAPDGSHVAYVVRLGGSFGNRVRRLPALDLVLEFNRSASPPRSLAFTPDSRRLLVSMILFSVRRTKRMSY